MNDRGDPSSRPENLDRKKLDRRYKDDEEQSVSQQTCNYWICKPLNKREIEMAPPVLFDTLLRERTAALLQSSSDYRRYAHHLSSRLHRLRKTLKVRRRISAKTNPKSAVVTASAETEATATSAPSSKYDAHVPSPSELATDKRFAGLLLLAAERAWAHAMETKATMENSASVAPEKRKHVLQRLEKARKHASQFASILLESDESGFSDYDKLQVVSYSALLAASGALEAFHYNKAVVQFSIAYTGLQGLALSLAGPDASDDDSDTADLYRDLLDSTVIPSLKFAALQVDPSLRSEAVSAIAHKFIPEDNVVVELVQKVAKDEVKVRELLTGKSDHADALEFVDSITWRSHTAHLRDATVAAAIVSARGADEGLSKTLADAKTETSAPAFDPALLAWQDAVDAIHETIVEANSSAGDDVQARVQELYIVSTFASYNLIARRIARDNLLASSLRTSLEAGTKKGAPVKSSASKLRALSGIYDAILQSIAQIVDLPGVASDEPLSDALASLQKYYSAHKCASDAAALLSGSPANVGSWMKAESLVSEIDEMALNLDGETKSDMTAELLFKADVPALRKLVASGLGSAKEQQAAAKVTQQKREYAKAHKGSAPFVVEDLTAEPVFVELDRLVDLQHIGKKIKPVPAKPVFFDTAFNFIGYEQSEQSSSTVPVAAAAGRGQAAVAGALADDAMETKDESTAATAKKGWFWRR
ncbi:hypothetical protein BZA70DRAFT_272719 [Myxozyma melibiosi]|uniref:Signal recognition particle subunit SRP68 n=1 Tax=Myxozyma melibiosi TaxID=54550 RepID=A0ABR1FDT7_9ASCO